MLSHARLCHVSRGELAGRPVAALALRGKELQLDAPAGEARRLLERHAVKLFPVLSGLRYVGAVDRDALVGVRDDVPVGRVARALAPVTPARTSAEAALAALDEHGETYVGVLCLRGRRDEVCVDPARLAADPRGARP